MTPTPQDAYFLIHIRHSGTSLHRNQPAVAGDQRLPRRHLYPVLHSGCEQKNHSVMRRPQSEDALSTPFGLRLRLWDLMRIQHAQKGRRRPVSTWRSQQIPANAGEWTRSNCRFFHAAVLSGAAQWRLASCSPPPVPHIGVLKGVATFSRDMKGARTYFLTRVH